MRGIDALTGTGAAYAAEESERLRRGGLPEDEKAAIREQGFLAYVEELNKKKIEEMRRKILEAMGLTEEDLATMPPERRAAVEKLVDGEIARRMRAGSLINNDETTAPLLPEAVAGGMPASGAGTSWAGLLVPGGQALPGNDGPREP